MPPFLYHHAEREKRRPNRQRAGSAARPKTAMIDTPMVLVTGAAGMLGCDLVVELRARGLAVTGVDLPDCDITNSAACDSSV